MMRINHWPSSLRGWFVMSSVRIWSFSSTCELERSRPRRWAFHFFELDWYGILIRNICIYLYIICSALYYRLTPSANDWHWASLGSFGRIALYKVISCAQFVVQITSWFGRLALDFSSPLPYVCVMIVIAMVWGGKRQPSRRRFCPLKVIAK